MPVFRLNDQPLFPPPEMAEPNGLLAIGGDLSVERLVAGYRLGIFPWFSPDDPILWWFTEPRLVLFPAELKLSARLRRYWRKTTTTCTIDQAFEAVISACAACRKPDREDTWITPEMISAYIDLHRGGYAHSVECWDRNKLVGGLYGVALDRVFFGESMFSEMANGSKFALIHLCSFLQRRGYRLIDCQMTTPHLISLGAREISGSSFRELLKKHIAHTAPSGAWSNDTEN